MVQKQNGGYDKTKTQTQTTVSFSELLKLGLTKNSEWPDEEVFLDWIYWSRQVVGILLGVVWGLIPLTGILGLALFGLGTCGYVFFYCSAFGIDDEAYGGIYEIIKEGFMTNFASFLVTWIIVYSSMHYDDLLAERL